MFYQFNQNYIGRIYMRDERLGIGPLIIVEGDTVDAINKKAEQVGIYFDGRKKGIDPLDNRWYRMMRNKDGYDEPHVYDVHIDKIPSAEWVGYDDVFIHYADGTMKRIIFKKNERQTSIGVEYSGSKTASIGYPTD